MARTRLRITVGVKTNTSQWKLLPVLPTTCTPATANRVMLWKPTFLWTNTVGYPSVTTPTNIILDCSQLWLTQVHDSWCPNNDNVGRVFTISNEVVLGNAAKLTHNGDAANYKNNTYGQSITTGNLGLGITNIRKYCYSCIKPWYAHTLSIAFQPGHHIREGQSASWKSSTQIYSYDSWIQTVVIWNETWSFKIVDSWGKTQSCWLVRGVQDVLAALSSVLSEQHSCHCSCRPTNSRSAKIAKVGCHLDLRHYFFSNRVINRRNPLAQTVTESCSVNSFKNGLDNMRALKLGFFVD